MERTYGQELIPNGRHVMRREERLGMPGGFVEGPTRRVVMLVFKAIGKSCLSQLDC